MNDELRELQKNIWRELEQSLTIPSHGWRTPILATVDTTYKPQARTIVLREVHRDKNSVVFYTDRRSPKVQQIEAQSAVQLVFWCAKLNWQLRASGTAKVIDSSSRVDAIWERIKNSSQALDYLAPEAPGSSYRAGHNERPDQHCLSLVEIELIELDWLKLDRAGHKRAKITETEMRWVIP